MARPRLHDDGLRRRLVDRAGRMVRETGAGGLSLRALAAAENTSTTAVYALFGNRAALLGALFEASFVSFGEAQRAIPLTGDTQADLSGLADAYRGWAAANPHLYGVMFGGALAGFEPDPDQAARASTTIEPLAEVVARGVATGELTGDPALITFSVWAAVHGVVSLTLVGSVPAEQVAGELFQATAGAIVRGWAVPADRREADPQSAN